MEGDNVIDRIGLLKEIVPLIQTLLWIGAIFILVKGILPKSSFLKEKISDRIEHGSAVKVGPVEIGDDKVAQKIAENQPIYQKAGQAAKDETKSQSDLEKIQRKADAELEREITPQERPFIRDIYLQKLTDLVKEFNRNRHSQTTETNSVRKGELVREGDKIAYKFRAMAPLLFNQLDISAWLASPNLGKRLAAIKYLDWAQDIEYAKALVELLLKLEEKRDTSQAYHILLALNSMADQLAFDYQDEIQMLIKPYTPSGAGASHRESLKNRIVEIIRRRKEFGLES